MSSPRRLRGAVACVLVLALGVTACGPTVSPAPTPTSTPSPAQPTATPPASGSPSPVPSGDANATYREIEAAVVRIRELEPREAIEPQLLDEDELKQRIEQSFRKDNPEELIAANEVLYRALGMLPEDESLTELYLELLGSQVAGFYDPEAEELFVVARSGGLGVTERVTYAHEFTHALQDQHFDLQSLGLDEVGVGDRSAARLALIEGDATAAMVFWAQTALSPEEALELLEDSQTPEQQAILERMPPVLRETLIFPYERGLQLVLRLQAQGGWRAVNDAFADPPASTEQVLHLEKYDAREAPIDVKLPDLDRQMGAGWTVPYEDTFGEFQFQVWLRNAIDATTGNAAAAGWGGDRFAVLQGPGDAWALVMMTTWDTPGDAREFEQAAGPVIREGDHQGTVLIDGRDVTIVVASDASTLNKSVSAAGFVVPS